MSSRAEKNVQRSKFGEYLYNLRKDNTDLSAAAVARELGMKNRQQLHYYETGRTLPSTLILIKLAQLYSVAPEELLERAYWPQLVLLPLVSVINTEELSEDMVEALERGLRDNERQQLTSFIAKLLEKRRPVRVP